MGARTLTLQEAAERLGVHYMTAYRYVRTGRLPGRRVGARWYVDPADLSVVFETAGRPGRLAAPRRGHSQERLSRLLVTRMVAGDEPGSWAVIEDALSRGTTPEEVVVGVVGAAMRSVGEQWQARELSVDDEHRAAGIAIRLVGRLGPLFARRGPKRGTVVIGAPPGERHGLPTALATNVLRGRRFDVIDLGADVPADAFATAVDKAENPLAAAIGVTGTGHDHGVRAIVRAIREAAPGLPVLVGGAGIADATHAVRLGARWGGSDATSLATAAESTCPEDL
jgi:excisionase family DNA binding protein